MESDDEPTEKSERAPSPVLQRSQSATQLSSAARSARTASPVRTETFVPPRINTPNLDDTSANMMPPQGTFTFRSSHAYPQDSDMSDLESSESTRAQSHDGTITSHHTATPSSTITITRPTRSNSRHSNQSTRVSGQAFQLHWPGCRPEAGRSI